MTTTTHETRIDVDPELPLVRITREFDAPPAEVFRAHTDPELFAQWVGPRDAETCIDVFDCRTAAPTASCRSATVRSTASAAVSTRCGPTS